MQITVICVGKLKERYWREAVDEYAKRLSAYCKLKILEAADERTPDQASEAAEEGIRGKEADRILRLIPEGGYVITLEIGGRPLDSTGLAARLEDLAVSGKSRIVFIIGGSLGLGKAVLRRSDFALSFSKMTFPHQMMRVILLEQIYRSFRIINKQPYHK